MNAILYHIDDSYKTIDLNTKVEQYVFFSLDDFRSIILNNCNCFICGTILNVANSSDEHIIPKWLLKYVGIFDDSIVFPNNKKINYSKLTIKCCKECNKNFGKIYEEKIPEILKNDFYSINHKLLNETADFNLLFIWLNFIYFKLHIKDLRIRIKENRSIQSRNVGDHYDWDSYHHIHCMFRSVLFNYKFCYKEIGSIFIFKINDKQKTNFHFTDSIVNKQILLCVNDYCIITILDDGGIIKHLYDKFVQKYFIDINKYQSAIKGGLTFYQLIEIYSIIMMLDLQFERPIFSSDISIQTFEKDLKLKNFKLDIFKENNTFFVNYIYDISVLGKALYNNLKAMTRSLNDTELSITLGIKMEDINQIKLGRSTFFI